MGFYIAYIVNGILQSVLVTFIHIQFLFKTKKRIMSWAIVVALQTIKFKRLNQKAKITGPR